MRRQLQVKTGGRVARPQLAQFQAAFSLTSEENLDDAWARLLGAIGAVCTRETVVA